MLLFPLHTVLFPGGTLRLRVFEPRYLELVRECTRENLPFGVCSILQGNEVGAPAVPAAVGTAARIVDFNVGQDGLLGIVARGEQRFHVDRLRVRDNGLLIADISLLEDATESVRPEHGLLATLLSHMLERAEKEGLRAGSIHLDDASWVGFRLAELLPIDDAQRQQVLQQPDPHQRLQLLLSILPRLSGGG